MHSVSIQSWTSPQYTWVLFFQQGRAAWCETSQLLLSWSLFLTLCFSWNSKEKAKCSQRLYTNARKCWWLVPSWQLYPHILRKERSQNTGAGGHLSRTNFFPSYHFLRIGCVLVTGRCPRDIIKQSRGGTLCVTQNTRGKHQDTTGAPHMPPTLCIIINPPKQSYEVCSIIIIVHKRKQVRRGKVTYPMSHCSRVTEQAFFPVMSDRKTDRNS